MFRQFFERSIQRTFDFPSLLKDIRVGDLFTGNNRRQKHEKATDYQSLENRQVLSANFPAYIGGQLTLGSSQSASPYELTDTFQLESNPNAKKTIYLDFNGHHSTGNAWKHSINFPSYNTSGSSKSFTRSELTEIQRIFQNVAEDFLPLDVNVTTRDPGSDDLRRTSARDSNFGIRVVVTQQTGNFGVGTGGLAKRNSFVDRRDTPAFVFNKGVNDAAWTISHEAGHTMGLTHDGFNGKTYHSGSGTGQTGWGPIMGGPFGKSLSQWSDGSYAGSDNRQDDLRIMTRSAIGVDFRPDDVGDTTKSADQLSVAKNRIGDWGTITSRSDVDFYRFTVGNAGVSISIRPFQGHGNLDVMAKLYSSSGELISTSNPIESTSASFNQTLKKGTYFLSVDGVGRTGRYTDYGSLGFYSIEGKITPQEVQPQIIGESGQLNLVDHQWRKVQFKGTFKNPVVIAGPPTSNDLKAGAVRIRNVNSNSFEIRMENWDYLTDAHRPESVGYMVVEAGQHELPDGTTLVAGNTHLNHRMRQVKLGSGFDQTPIVFSQVNSARGGSTVISRIQKVSSKSFESYLQEEEGNDGSHKTERVGWIAIEPNQGSGADLLVSAENLVNHKPTQLHFERRFEKTPVLIAQTQTRNGTDPATLRIHKPDNERTTIFLQEETSADPETVHVQETLAYLITKPGQITGSSDSLSRQESKPQLRARDLAFENAGDSISHTNRDFAKLNSFQHRFATR